jgi:hypothetical protein
MNKLMKFQLFNESKIQKDIDFITLTKCNDLVYFLFYYNPNMEFL